MDGSDAFGLLERAIAYALGAVRGVTADRLRAPTPCVGWDLGTLLRHVNESLDLLHECFAGPTATAPPATDPLDLFRGRATRLVAEDLGTLLRHVNESLDLLHECFAGPTATAPPATDPLDLFRGRATRLVA